MSFTRRARRRAAPRLRSAYSARWIERIDLALARRSQIHDAKTLVCRRTDGPYDQPGRARVKKCTTDHLGRARPIRPRQYPAIPGEVTGLSLVTVDSNEALAIRRNDDAPDSTQIGGLD